MPALSEMPPHEQQLADEDPDLLRACSMTGSIRWLEIYRAYLLAERLDKAPLEEHQEIIAAWGRAMGITPGTLASHLRWPRMIRMEDLLGVFEEESISESEWTARVGTSMLKTIARAKRQDSNKLLTSREMAEWARRCYHANLSCEELENMLRDHDMLPPKRNSKTKPIQAGRPTACTLGIQMFAALKEQGKDIDLSGMMARREKGKPIDVAAFLEFLRAEFKREHDGAKFSPGEG